MLRFSVALMALSLTGWARADDPKIQPTEVTAGEDESVLFLGVGNVEGLGQIVQVDLTGTDLGRVDLDGTPYSLATAGDFVFAVVPSQGKIYRIVRNGNVTPLFSTGEISHPIAIAVDPETERIFVGDNLADRIVRITPGQDKDDVLQIQEPDRQLQNLSLAALSASQIVFSGSQPLGVYLGIFESEANSRMLLPEEGDVAAKPGSTIWIAAQREVIKVFDGIEETSTISLPDGMRLYRSGMLAFTRNGKLLAAVNKQADVAVTQVDLETGEFVELFQWQGVRLVCMAAGRKLNWNNAPEDSQIEQ